MGLVKFGDLVNEVKINIDRNNNPYEYYVAGDHMDSEDLTIRRKGSFATDDVGPAFTRLFKPGQILYGSRRTYLKKVAVADFEGICSNTTFVLETKDENKLRQRLLPFIMLTDDFTKWSISKSKGSTNPYILFSDLANYEFELPDISRQDELVELLWQAYATKESYKEMIRATDEMVKSQFIEQFSGDNIPRYELSSLCSAFLDGDWIESKDQSDAGYRLVQTGNVGVGEYIDKSGRARYVSEETFKRLNCTEIFSGDILFSRLPEPLGRCCIIPEDFPKAITAVDCTIARLNEKCLPEFLVVYTSTSMYSSQVDKCVTGTTRQRISRNNLAKISVPCPSREEQIGFVKIVRQADKSKFAGFKSQFIEKIGDSRSNPKDWDIYTLREIVVPSCPISYGIVQPGEDIEEGGVPIVRPVDLDDTHWVTAKGLKSTTKEISDAYRRTILDGNELLLCVRGTTGLVGLATEELKGCNVTRGITPLSFNERVDRVFMLCMFLSDGIQEFISDNTIGSALRGINMAVIREMKFPVPPIDIQRSFASLYEQADKSKYLNSNKPLRR